MYIGTAAWSLPREVAAEFPGDGQQLERYARQFACAEINSSFYKPHRTETYARWAGMTPPHFRFAVKLPRAITHDGRLRAARKPLRAFLAEAAGLGDRLGVLLVQLPPSLPFESRVARTFFALLRDPKALPPSQERQFRAQRNDLSRLLSGVFDDGVRRGAIRPGFDTRVAAESVLGMIRGINRYGREYTTPDRAVEIVTSIFLDGYGAR